MTTHHCGTYLSDPLCNCYNEKGDQQHHYKQFDTVKQVYSCCDHIYIPLRRLGELATPVDGTLNMDALTFFNDIYENNLTGCCYTQYFLDPDTQTTSNPYFIKNYPQLNNDFFTVTSLYNQFIADTTPPVTDNNNVTCTAAGYFPYILEYKSPGEVYYNTSYICSQNTNDVFNPLSAPYSPGKIDYKIKRFLDNSTGQLCTGQTCQLVSSDGLNNFGSIENQGNKGPVYQNHTPGEKYGFIASAVLAIILIIVTIFIFRDVNKKLDKIENP